VPERRRAAVDASGHHRNLTYPELPEPLPVPVYDNHTHIEMADGEGLPVAEQLRRAAAVGIRGIVQVGNDIPTSEWSARQAAAHPEILAAVALHPTVAARAARAGTLDDDLAKIYELSGLPRVRAIGETGLDWHEMQPGDRDPQIQSFLAHIEMAKLRGIALQIHDRDAHADVVETLLCNGAPERTVFHCFSGDAELARLCARHGWYLSFSGTVTFKNAPAIREALRVAPADHILVETDAPFLTPHPFRGRPNAPYLVPVTLRSMAQTRGVPVEDLAAQIVANTHDVYGSWE
jgi:TatD DNase family protein